MGKSFPIIVLALMLSATFSTSYCQTANTGNQQLLLVDLSASGSILVKNFGITIYWLDRDVEFIQIETEKGMESGDWYQKIFMEISKVLNNLYEKGWKLKSTLIKTYTSQGNTILGSTERDCYQYYLEKL